ncbi:hypothetical protein, partial [Flavobacterium sp. ACN2]|uniref:hypothetical protein n=1 Tax=Flavobacterium sp. ACN2 TaxID=1975676 RepID=UPI001C0ED466
KYYFSILQYKSINTQQKHNICHKKILINHKNIFFDKIKIPYYIYFSFLYAIGCVYFNLKIILALQTKNHYYEKKKNKISDSYTILIFVFCPK